MHRTAPQLDEESPCDRCRLYTACSTQQLACKAYVYYCQDKLWLCAERAPTHQIFMRLYRRPSDKEYAKLEAHLADLRERRKRTMEANGTKPGRKALEPAAQ